MALTPGTRLGPYEIQAVIGAGGMGEVYRARDIRLERDVAVKILPAGFASDVSARERFHREAKTVAALNHPHICTLHDIGQEGETSFLVMELVEGETLAGLIAGKPIPLATALTIAGQIADALDKAHRAGIAHRDLKPANVMLAKQRGAVHVKLLDFGLAKTAGLQVSQSAPGAAALTMTASPSLTAAGSIVGTLHYMAPEQLEGKDADLRSDIWAFGCVLYEMLTGARPFEGKSSVSLMAAILEHEPEPITVRQPSTPPGLDHIITRCLAKDPETRWQSARDLAIELRWIAERGGRTETARAIPIKPSSRRIRWAATVAIAAAAAIAGAAIGARWFANPAADADGPVMFDIDAPSTALDSIAASPDGRFIAYTGEAGGEARLLLREVASNASRTLSGTEGATRPFWSPDSRSIAFFTPTELKRIDLSGAVPAKLAQLPVENAISNSGSWSEGGQILFGQISGGGIRSISDQGGAVAKITLVRTDKLEQNHLYPQSLPGGRALLYLRTRGPNLAEDSEVVLRSLDTNQEHVVLNAYSRLEFAPPNWLVYTTGQDPALLAQRFDLSTGARLGDSRMLVPSILRLGDLMSLRALTASSRLLAYRTGRSVRSQLTWFSRTGVAGAVLTSLPQTDNAVIDPSGEFIAANGSSSGGTAGDIWVADIRRGTVSRLTFDPSADSAPVFSPDGRTIAFSSARNPAGLYRKLASGVAREELLAATGPAPLTGDWSRNGRHIVYQKAFDLWLLTLDSPPTTSALITDPGGQEHAHFSPDTRRIAYSSNETGPSEVFVQDFPVSGAKWQASSAGGTEPRWREDGRELYYLGADGRLMAVDVVEGPEFKLGLPRALFQTRLMELRSPLRGYGVADHGQRFLMNVAAGDEGGMPITVVVNWQRLLDQRGAK